MAALSEALKEHSLVGWGGEFQPLKDYSTVNKFDPPWMRSSGCAFSTGWTVHMYTHPSPYSLTPAPPRPLPRHSGGFTVRSWEGSRSLSAMMSNNPNLRVAVCGWELVSVPLLESLQASGCRQLGMLIFQGSRFEAGSLPVLARMMKQCTSLTDLRVTYIDDGGEDISQFLTPELSLPSSIRKLCLSYNGIDDAGMTALSKSLGKCSSLESLTLHRNNIGAAGVTALAEVLESNHELLELDMAYNNVGEAGAHSLSKALVSATRLTNINLAGNKLSTYGALALAPFLRISSSITSLNLHCNDIWAGKTKGHDVHDEAWKLIALLDSCQSLKSVDLTYNGIQTFVSEDMRRFTQGMFATSHTSEESSRRGSLNEQSPLQPGPVVATLGSNGGAGGAGGGSMGASHPACIRPSEVRG
jgi:hypothetical protein